MNDPDLHGDSSEPRLLGHGPGNGRPLPAYPPASVYDGGVRDLGGIVAVLWRQRWLVGATALVVAVLVVVAFQFLPEMYRSHVTMLVDAPASGGPTGLAILERVWSGADVETEVGLLRSRGVVEPVVDRLDLNATVVDGKGERRRPREVFPRFAVDAGAPGGSYTLRMQTRRGWTEWSSSWQPEIVITNTDNDSVVATGVGGDSITFDGITLQLPAESADGAFGEIELSVASLPEAIPDVLGQVETARAGPDSRLVLMECVDEDPIHAQTVCREISESYLRLRTELGRAEATTTAAFLADQVTQVGARLEAAEDSLQRFTRQNQLVALGTRANEEVSILASVKAERDKMAADRAALQQLIADIERDGDTRRYRDLASFPIFLQNDAIESLLGVLVELENQRATLAVRRTEENPEFAALNDRITSIEEQLYSFATTHVAALDAQIQSLDTSLAERGVRIAGIPTQQVELARLERQATLFADLYQLLQTRLSEAQVAEAVTLPHIRIVDRASMPTEAEGVGLTRSLALGLFLGVGFGVLLAFFRETTDTRIRGRDEIQTLLGLPVLSSIPSHRPESSLAGGRRTGANLVERTPEQLALHESFVSLATDLRFAWDRASLGDLKSIAIVSSSRGEGKTLVARHLALTAAAEGKRVLLIDGDLRSGGVTGLFKLRSARPGLSQILSDGVRLRDAVCPHEVGLRGQLAVLPSGGFDQRDARPFDGSEFRSLLEEAAEQGCFTVVDTPPLTLLSDAVSIASAVDGVLLVVRSGMTQRPDLELSLERLARSGARVLGVVLNDVQLSEQQYDRYAYS